MQCGQEMGPNESSGITYNYQVKGNLHNIEYLEAIWIKEFPNKAEQKL